MKKLIIIALMLCSGCSELKFNYKCDGGFQTGESYYVLQDDGVIHWISVKGGSKSSYKMKPGEICTRTAIYK